MLTPRTSSRPGADSSRAGLGAPPSNSAHPGPCPYPGRARGTGNKPTSRNATWPCGPGLRAHARAVSAARLTARAELAPKPTLSRNFLEPHATPTPEPGRPQPRRPPSRSSPCSPCTCFCWTWRILPQSRPASSPPRRHLHPGLCLEDGTQPRSRQPQGGLVHGPPRASGGTTGPPHPRLLPAAAGEQSACSGKRHSPSPDGLSGWCRLASRLWRLWALPQAAKRFRRAYQESHTAC